MNQPLTEEEIKFIKYILKVFKGKVVKIEEKKEKT